MGDDVTPVQLATFDQALADVEYNLDVLCDLYRNGDPDSPEHIRVAGFCRFLGGWAQFNSTALAEHLAVAVRRLVDASAPKEPSDVVDPGGGP